LGELTDMYPLNLNPLLTINHNPNTNATCESVYDVWYKSQEEQAWQIIKVEHWTRCSDAKANGAVK